MSERTTMSERALTRRELIAGGMTLGAAGLLAACVGTTSGGGGGGAASTGAVTLQNSIQDADPKAALEALVKAYPGGDATMNSVATESVGRNHAG
jgi:multiple sugar transport system substrate-binding protein